MTSSKDTPRSPAPPIITHAGPLLARYDVLFCDVWGVVHDGVHAYSKATDALIHFRGRGGTVVLVTNAPVPVHRVEAMLEARRVPPESYDAIVSSGAIALRHISEKGYRRAVFIGPADRDAAFFAAATAAHAPLDEAEAVVCTGLTDDVRETAESYRGLLTEAHALGLPFVCANPDLVVDVGGRLFPCAGALGDLYAHLGGEVFWAGKPHAVAYAAAKEAAEAARGRAVEPGRILVIGDAVRTDLAGAATAGLDALFIAGGIHRKEAMSAGVLTAEGLQRLFPPGAPPAVAAMAELAW
jgi:HAD superfamily hydrolase (TIGR01459 family)